MSRNLLIRLWKNIDEQKWDELPEFFAPNAVIHWVDTNEQLTVDEYIFANSKYPGRWHTSVQRIEESETTFVTVTKLWEESSGRAVHAVSFFEIEEGKISYLQEYFGEIGEPPLWRQELHLGGPITG